MEVKKKKTPKFQRTKFRAYVKLGSGQKSKQKYRKATGRHNKTRQKWKSRPPRVEIGYKQEVKNRGLIKGKIPVVIKSVIELKQVKENEIAIIGKVGAKRRLEIVKEAEKSKIRFENLNIKKFLRKVERAEKHKNKMKEEKKKVAKKKEKKENKKAAKTEDEKTEDKEKKEAAAAPKDVPSEEGKDEKTAPKGVPSDTKNGTSEGKNKETSK